MFLIVVAILYLISLVLLILNRFSIRPGYSWFMAIIGSVVALGLLVFSFNSEPQVYTLMGWDIKPLFIGSLSLLVDLFSWPFAVAVATLMASVLLTDVARVQDIPPGSWAAGLAMTGTGILAVASANPLTLLLAWSLIDILEINILLRVVSNSAQRERVVVTFFVRVVGLLLVVAAILRSKAIGVTFTFTEIPLEAAGYLILAAGLRLGVIPPHPPFFHETYSRRSLATIIRLVPVAASLVLVARVAAVGVPPKWELALMIIAAWVLIYGAFTWSTSPDELEGRPFWIFGLSALAVASAAQVQPSASIAWGLALLFSGGMIFLYSARSPKFIWLLSLGLMGFSAIPFTPAWPGAILFSEMNTVYSLVFSTGLAILMLGYFKHLLRKDDPEGEIERWVWIVYPIGLAILPLTHFGVIWSLGGLIPPQEELISLAWWGGVVSVGVAGLIWGVSRREFQWAVRIIDSIRNSSSLGWFYRILWWGYRNLSKLISYIERLFEGEGGILWAVLIIILLVLVIVQGARGG